MSWKLRHQGSPRAVENLTLVQVVEGMKDGNWEPTDEVMGPGDVRWSAIESHPKLAETAQEIEDALHQPRREEETSIDMVPLIDVCMVLLVFFILTTSYQALEKILNMPQASSDDPNAQLREVKPEDVKDLMVTVRARPGADGKAVYHVQDKATPERELTAAISRYTREIRRTEVLIDALNVDWGSVVKIIDASGGARVSKVHFVVGGQQQ